MKKIQSNFCCNKYMHRLRFKYIYCILFVIFAVILPLRIFFNYNYKYFKRLSRRITAVSRDIVTHVKIIDSFHNKEGYDFNSRTNCLTNDAIYRVTSKLDKIHKFTKYLLVSEYENLDPCIYLPSLTSAPTIHKKNVNNLKTFRDAIDIHSKNILTIVMTGSHDDHNLAANARNTWGKDRENIIFISDDHEKSIGIETFPNLKGKTSKADAQHRQFTAMKAVYSNKKKYTNKKWYFLVDDDTFVNYNQLVDFVAHLNYKIPVIFGFVWTEKEWQTELPFPSGGAGILLSKAAFDKVVPELYDGKCPFKGVNDVTIGTCANALSILLVHTNKLSPNNQPYAGFSKSLKGHMYHVPNLLLDKITIHYATNYKLINDILTYSNKREKIENEINKVKLEMSK